MKISLDIIRFTFVVFTLSLISCNSNKVKYDLDDVTIPIEQRYADFSKRALKRERDQIKEKIFQIYNQTAQPEDVIVCSTERVRGSRTERRRMCTTQKHREELSEAAKGEFCNRGRGGAFFGCDGATGTMDNRMVNHRAEQQMQRINMEIKTMANVNPEIKRLLVKEQQLQKLYLSK